MADTGVQRRTDQEPASFLQARREKLDAIVDAGLEPYAYRFDRSHDSSAAVRAFEHAESGEELDEHERGPRVRVAGRLVSRRGHGKTSFAHLDDGAGRIQVYFRKDTLGDERFGQLDLTDLGDWLGVDGVTFRTRTGEVTVLVEAWTLLSKALRPLPLGKVEVDPDTGERRVHSGFRNTESRYRQRYADLAVHPEVREVFRQRGRIITEMRTFLEGRGFVEVETPVLQPIYGGASARPFVTRHNTLDMELYLRIADELYLKRLIVGGMDRVYEISKDFRNEGVDRFHNPEFTMLEFYQAFADYEDMMEVVESLMAHLVRALHGSTSFTFQGHTIDVKPPFRRLPLMDALSEAMGVDAADIPTEELRARAKALSIPELAGAGRGKLLDKLFGELVEPDLIQPTFVVDHPRELSPLAKPKRGDPTLTERFELYLAGREMANAFSELNDPIDQRRRFEEQVRLREAGDDEAQTVDEDYLRALEYGLPPTGGVGVGVDRVVMMLTDQPSIRDVILFPTLRPEEGDVEADDEEA